jgi:hypothetical protein
MFWNSLDFLAENSRWGGTREGALKGVQFWKSSDWEFTRSLSHEEFDKAFNRFVPEFSLKSLEDWHKDNQQLKHLNDKLAVFAEFANREQIFEPIEEVVNEAAIELEAAIQMEVDRLRGK